jgi:uncharacterized protein YecE (DUF72 family)
MSDDRQIHSNRQRQLRVGCCGLGNNRQSYFKQFSLLEYQQSFFSPPKPSSLKQLSQLAPEGFAFFVRAWQLITHEPSSASYRRLATPLAVPPDQVGHFRPTPAVEEAARSTLQMAQLLSARGILFETPASFTPSSAHRQNLTHFFERFDRGLCLCVWDPRGLWSTDETLAICRDLNLVLSWDPIVQVEQLKTPVAYWRLSQMGRAQSYSDLQLEQLVAQAESYETVFCLFNSVTMGRDAARLKALC